MLEYFKQDEVQACDAMLYKVSLFWNSIGLDLVNFPIRVVIEN